MKPKTKKEKLVILAGIIIILFAGSLLLNSVEDQYKTGGIGGEIMEDTIFSRSTEQIAVSSAPVTEVYYGDEAAYDLNESEQHIIKTGALSLIVQDIDIAANQIYDIAAMYGGAITNQYIYSYDTGKNGSIDLKVEENNFEAAMASIKEIAQTVTSENINSDDVTETVIDLEVRLENAQAEEEAYLNVLDAAETVEDILNVQKYLSDVREEIERYEAQLEYYSSRTSYSNITVYLEEAESITLESDEFQPWQTVKDSVQTVIRLFQGLVLEVIRLVIVGAAIAIPILILFFAGRFIYRRYKK